MAHAEDFPYVSRSAARDLRAEQCAGRSDAGGRAGGLQRLSGNDARRRADPAAERERAQRYDSDDSGHLYDGVVFSAEGGAQYRHGGVDGRRGTRPERGGDTHSGQQPGQRRGAGQPGAVAQAEARQERIACAHRRR